MESKKIVENTKLHPLGVVCHAFSPDFSMLAASIKEENVVNIYGVGDLETPQQWKLLHTLSEHSQTISVVDWSSKNKILTGSHDRNVFVWSYNDQRKEWVPSLVILHKQNRAILDGCWNIFGNKFLIGTGSYRAYSGYYSPQNDWWDGLQVNEKKFTSSVTSVAFHPSGFVVALGSTDYSIRIVTNYLEAAGDDKLNYTGAFSKIRSFGEELYRIKNAGSWVESLQWNSAGNLLAAAVHSSSVVFVQVGDNDAITESDVNLDWEKCPFKTVMFLDDSTVLAGGYDKAPISFKKSGNAWNFVKAYTRDKKKEELKRGSVQSNLRMFESNKLGQAAPKEENEAHSNPVACVRVYQGKPGNVQMFSSNDIHGNLFFWKV